MSETPTEIALLPCPFCGAAAYYTKAVNGTEVHRVGCSFCGIVFKAMEIHYPDPDNDHLTKDIVAAWNTRIAAALAESARAAVVDARREAVEIVTNFRGWIACECYECRGDVHAHAINEQESLAAIVAELEAARTEEEK